MSAPALVTSAPPGTTSGAPCSGWSRQFESRTLPKEEWTHQAHLTMGFWYASHLPPRRRSTGCGRASCD